MTPLPLNFAPENKRKPRPRSVKQNTKELMIVFLQMRRLIPDIALRRAHVSDFVLSAVFDEHHVHVCFHHARFLVQHSQGTLRSRVFTRTRQRKKRRKDIVTHTALGRKSRTRQYSFLHKKKKREEVVTLFLVFQQRFLDSGE